MKKTNYSIKKLFKRGIATLLTASMVVTAVQAPAFADNVDEEVTESSASVTGLVHKKITLELVSDELKEAALTAIRENRLFDAEDYLAATGDNQKALREYEAFFNENPGLYVVDVPESVVDTLSGEDAELRIFVQKDAKMAKVDLTASPSEITREDSTESKNVEFRYGTDKDIILYEPASNVDTLVNGGEDAYYIEPEQEIGDNSDYELTGNEKITFMFVNSSEGTVRFTLKVDGVTYDKVEVGGREAALKKIIAEAGTKKSTEETTAAETTAAVTAVTEETTVADETTAAEVQEVETEAPAEETTAEGTEIANADDDNVSAETEETTAAVEETAAETEAPAADTDAEVKEEAPTEVTEEPETEATIPEKIAEAISEVFGGASDAVLGRMTVYADTIVGEGAQFEVEENAPAAEDSEEEEDKDTNEVAAQAVEAAAGEDTATEADEVNEETTAAVEAAADDNAALAADTTALQIEVSEGLSEDKAENQVEETVAQEVTVVETEPETVAETQAVKETIAKDDETKAAKVATASEIAEYDDVALELIAEVKEEVLQDKAAAKENIKVARIAQYTINELGKIHYETEVDGFNVEVFAAKDAFGDITPTLEAKKLAKPEEAEASEDTLSDDQVEELKDNGIYDNSLPLDIHFLDGDKEVEPTKAVKVKITISDENLLNSIDASSLEVHHIKETDDTFKTEKVAATEDVKLLDKNDEEIKDSDFEANAEAAAAGEEVEVEVASAVAEFEVDDFSVYAIVWTQNNYSKKIAKVIVHYIDTTGKEIFDNRHESNKELETTTEIKLDAQFAGTVSQHTFKEARLGSKDGQIITSLKKAERTNVDRTNDIDYNIDYFYTNAQNKKILVASNTIKNKLEPSTYGRYDSYGNRLYDWRKNVITSSYYYGSVYSRVIYDKGNGELDDDYILYTGTRYEYTSETDSLEHDIYLIYDYTPNGTVVPPKTQVKDLGAPTTSKSVSDNKDGTYTLTLSVTGASQAQTSKTHANVVVVLDLSGSMLEVASAEGSYEPDEYGSYYEQNANAKLKYKREWYTYSDEVIGWHYEYDRWGRRYVKLDYRKIYHSELVDVPDVNTYDTVYLPDGQPYDGTRYAYFKAGTRLEIAKSAIQSLSSTLLANNTAADSDVVELGLVTFADRTKVYKAKTNADEFNSIIDGLSAEGGTNWEGGLADANGYSFGFDDEDPVYIIFVSDGNPTYRVSQNSYNDHKEGDRLYGDGYEETPGNISRCLEAAKLVSGAILNSNKKLYAVNAFSGSTANSAQANMRALYGTDTALADKYTFNAISQKELNSALSTILKEIQHDLRYTDVNIVDTISHYTATMDVLGAVDTDKYTYEVTQMVSRKEIVDGEEKDVTVEETVYTDEDILKDDNLSKIRTASFNNGKVTWQLGDCTQENGAFILESGKTYKVSFVVWPKQEAYDILADIENGKYEGREDEIPKGFVELLDANGDGTGKYVYQTNDGATVKYKNVDFVDNEPVYDDDFKDGGSIDVYPYMEMNDTKLSYQKKWIMDSEDQRKFIEDKTITLDLYKGDDKYIEGLSLTSPEGDDDYIPTGDGKIEVIWRAGANQQKHIAPGILVSKAKGDARGFKPTNERPLIKKKGTNEEFYLVEKGHNYTFKETKGVVGFELENKVYHPMVVDGHLQDVEFNSDMTEFEIVTEATTTADADTTEGDDTNSTTTTTTDTDIPDVRLETITAVNIINLAKLTVTKKYVGTMAKCQPTTFDLYLYKADGTPATYEEEKYIEDLNYDSKNKTGLLMEKQNDGAYRFTITPSALGSEQPVDIMLPGDVSYIINEVRTGTSYADYIPTSSWTGKRTTNSGENGAEVVTPFSGEGTDTTGEDPLKLSEVNKVDFVNTKNYVAPTGIGDNTIPFVALALTGLASMVFLAYDFQKRRLFED
ncbi:vWA domain-containing protein [Oribacterium sp. NK2B42]|uniref:vWA domain-containing protein n=1 Tax=Oribacterium sp. NK2B42 TaxID=689781 RepID=UPI000418AAC4|nr:vWA domain-containing protein [Oribacterium sp. NK2B42]